MSMGGSRVTLDDQVVWKHHVGSQAVAAARPVNARKTPVLGVFLFFGEDGL